MFLLHKTFTAKSGDGKQLRVYAERLGAAFYCAPARPPEDRRGGLRGGLGPGAPGGGTRLSAARRFCNIWFTLFCVLLLC